MCRAVNQLDVRARLPLVDMTLPALRALSRSQYETFSQSFVQLVQADKRLGLFEWTLHQILLRHLRPQFEPVGHRRSSTTDCSGLTEQCSVLLSVLARASQRDDRYRIRCRCPAAVECPVQLLPPEACALDALEDALARVVADGAEVRQRLVDACAACICADAAVNVSEAELLRAICDMLDCPMPPLLPGQQCTGRVRRLWSRRAVARGYGI